MAYYPPHLTPAVEAAVHLPEATHADHLLHVQLGEADVRRIESAKLLLWQVREVEVTRRHEVAREHADLRYGWMTNELSRLN